VIILDISCRISTATKSAGRCEQRRAPGHIPVIFLTKKTTQRQVQGLELGADNYITKPFDIEELKLYVQNAISRSERESLTDPQSGLPAGRLIEDQLRKMIRQKGWAFMDIRINAFDVFKDVYGFIAGANVLRFTAILLGEVADEIGGPDDFIGHAGGDNFVVVTQEVHAANFKRRLKERFAQEVLTHYNFMDRQQGYLLTPDENGSMHKQPLMSLAVGLVSPATHAFADIREITELAAEERRQDAG